MCECLYYICILALFSFPPSCVSSQTHLTPLGHGSPVQTVTVLESLPTPEYFYRWFIKPGHPVLIKGALDKPGFHSPAYSLWTDEYLREKYGRWMVTYEEHKKETRNREDYHEGRFRQFLDTYQTSDTYLVLDLSAVPRMLEDMSLPPFLSCGGIQSQLTLYNMWMSGGDTKSVLHNDEMDNVNCIMAGSKDLVFFDKKYKAEVEADGWDDATSYSKVDVDRVDLEQYPKFKHLPWMHARMEKGDCLFIPKNWYHQVNSEGPRNLAVNQWFRQPLWFNSSDCMNQPPVQPLSNYPADYYFGVKRETVFEVLQDHPYLLRPHLDVLLTDNSSSEEVFTYLDLDSDGRVDWEEVTQVNMEDFLHRFETLLNEDLRGLVEDATDSETDAESTTTSDDLQENGKTEL